MNKRHLHHVWRRLKPINTWFFFGGFIVFLCMGIYGARANNLTSIKLRDEVLAADQAGTDVEAPLQKLREHMYSHMNAGLASGSLQQPIQLKYRYQRLVEAEKLRVTQTNDQIYTEAQKYCEALYPTGLSGGPRVPCIKQYVTEKGASEQTIPDALYKFNFISPSWSPDLAGWSLLLSGVFLALFLIRLLLERWMKAEMAQHL